MLAFFPTPFPDETLHSIAARWYVLSGFSSPAIFLQAAFPSPIDFDSCDLGARAVLVSSVGYTMSWQEVAAQHSLQPFFRHFLDEKVMTKFASGKASYTARKYLSKELRCCALCAAEQRSTAGIAVWLRAHNLPGVLVCHLHECRLHIVEKGVAGLDTVPFWIDEEGFKPASSTELWYAKEANLVLQGLNGHTAFRDLFHSLREAIRRRYRGAIKNDSGSHGSTNRAAFTSALSASMSDAGASHTQLMNGDALLSRVTKELGTASVGIHPVTAIHVANVSYDGGIQALLRDLPRREPRVRIAKKKQPKRKKELGPLQQKWATQQKQAMAAARKLSRAEEKARLSGLPLHPMYSGLPVIVLNPPSETGVVTWTLRHEHPRAGDESLGRLRINDVDCSLEGARSHGSATPCPLETEAGLTRQLGETAFCKYGLHGSISRRRWDL